MRGSAKSSHSAGSGAPQIMVPPRGKTFVSVHASIHNHVDQDCHLNRRNIFKEDRSTALAEWHQMFG